MILWFQSHALQFREWCEFELESSSLKGEEHNQDTSQFFFCFCFFFLLECDFYWTLNCPGIRIVHIRIDRDPPSYIKCPAATTIQRNLEIWKCNAATNLLLNEPEYELKTWIIPIRAKYPPFDEKRWGVTCYHGVILLHMIWYVTNNYCMDSGFCRCPHADHAAPSLFSTCFGFLVTKGQNRHKIINNNFNAAQPYTSQVYPL